MGSNTYDYSFFIEMTISELKVRKFQNEYMKRRIAQNMNEKIRKIQPALNFRAEFF